MSLLTDDEIGVVFDAIPAGKDRAWFLRYAEAIESALIAKLAEQDATAKAVNLMAPMTDDQRLDVMGHFCTHCGCVQSAFRCQCWNDE